MRIKEIVRIIYSLERFVSIDMLMEEFNVSKRTIQYDLNVLTSIDEENGFQLISQRGLGYKVLVFDKEKFDNYIEYDAEESLLQLDETIAGYLLLHDRFVTRKELADLFLVSSSTILSHVDIIKSHLKEVDLEIERKSQHGWRVVVKSNNRISLLIKVFGPENSWVSNQMNKKVAEEEVDRFINHLFELLSNNDLEIIHGSFEILREWASMYILYNELNKREISHVEVYEADDKRNFHKRLSKIVGQLFVKMGWPHEKENIEDLINLLKKSVRKSYSQKIKSKEIEEITQDYLRKLDLKHGSSFGNNSDFVNRLIIHVSALVERLLEDNTAIDLPKNEYRELLINEIVFKYPIMFSFSLGYSDLIQAQYDITIDNYERALIASYFIVLKEQEEHKKLNEYERIGVVCGTGGGSSLFIKMKIKNIFHHSIIETFSFIDISKIEKFKPDLIFTIKDFQTSLDVPIIVIKEFIEDDELLKIERQLKQNLLVDNMKQDHDIFNQIFSSKVWKRTEKASSYISEIKKMSEELVEKKYANQDFPELILEREEYMSTVYLNGVAMPHPIKISSKKNVISVNILENPSITDEGKEVSIIFLMCLNKKGYELMTDITQELYNIMIDKVLVSELVKAKTFGEFIEIIKRRN